MGCYRSGGCGPYENYSCSECPASKPEYAKRMEKHKYDLQQSDFAIDRKRLGQIKNLIDEMLGPDGSNMPSRDELDFDDDAVNMYQDLLMLQGAMSRMGI